MIDVKPIATLPAAAPIFIYVRRVSPSVTLSGIVSFVMCHLLRVIRLAARLPTFITGLSFFFGGSFASSLLTIAALSFLFWVTIPTYVPGTFLGTGPQVQTGTFTALAVLVLRNPCALGIATPLALIRGSGKTATQCILIRSGDAFQIFPDVDQIVLDKTGTITVSEVVALQGDEGWW